MKITVMLATAGVALFAPSGLLRRSLRAFGGIGRKRRGRRSIEVLRTLDDRLLADIGVDRCSLGFAACHGRMPPAPVPRGPRRLVLVRAVETRPRPDRAA